MGKTERPINTRLIENEQRLTPVYDVLEIVGEAGTGTTSTGLVLAELHDARFISIGDIVGKINQGIWQGRLLEDGRELNVAIDKKVDRLGQLIIRNALPQYPNTNGRRPVVVDSRMGAYFAIKGKQEAEEKGQPFPNVVKIKLTADEDVRISRLSEREGISKEEIRRITTRRDTMDSETYRKLQGQDVASNNFFDLIVDNSNLNVDQTVSSINQWLKRNNYVK
mgnify:CR=1 FL=1